MVGIDACATKTITPSPGREYPELRLEATHMAVSAVLKRFDRYFYQPRPSDGAIVPIDLGILAFYAQGATLVEQVSLAAGATSAAVHVYHPGTFVTGGAVHNASLVYSGEGSDSRQTELWFNADGTVLFKNLGAAFVFAAGSRFLNSGVPLRSRNKIT